jgi:hypothetical protein
MPKEFVKSIIKKDLPLAEKELPFVLPGETIL